MNPTRSRPFLTRLARDTSGNTLAIMAAALFPLVGLIGGGVDMSRMYLVKTRLQQACDAGALAGRKAMGGGGWTAATEASADELFTANFADGAYGTDGLASDFAEANGVVTGTASVQVPMTLMRVFGFAERSASVNCTAKMEIPNTDIMFVLDTTGSMRCRPEEASCWGDAGTESKMAGLRTAVNCFYETVARLDIADTDCGSTPGGGVGTAQIRFGFVPYATNVNVGRLLPNDFMVDSWFYQTRQANMAVPPQQTVTRWEVYPTSITQAECVEYMNNRAFGSFTPTPASSGGPPPTPTVETTFPGGSVADDDHDNGEWGWKGDWRGRGGAPDQSGTSRTCRRKRTDTTTYYQEKFQNWTYGRLEVDVSALKAGGSSWNASFQQPIGDTAVGSDLTTATITWDGCIEERETAVTDDFDPIPDNAFDLDIDRVPDSDQTRWKPALPRLVFTRNGSSGSAYRTSWGGSNTSSWFNTASTTTTTVLNSTFSYACPSPARKLQQWPNAGLFDGYVDDLEPNGNTYHDIGILWGARLMSPTGIFASENALTPNGGAIDRHMIFMTDGDTNGNISDYAAYGLPFFDQRQTSGTPTKADMDNQINARFLALCNAVRNMNITLWVISFGEGVGAESQERLEQCATPGRFFTADNSDELIDQFRQIANEIADLRLTS